MSNYVRREHLEGCKLHREIFVEAHVLLDKHGYFTKQEVIETTKLEGVADGIRWDYVYDSLQKVLEGLELVPVASRFFTHPHSSGDRYVPMRFIASGHGKKTAGYALVSHTDEGRLLVRPWEQLKPKAS